MSVVSLIIAKFIDDDAVGTLSDTDLASQLQAALKDHLPPGETPEGQVFRFCSNVRWVWALRRLPQNQKIAFILRYVEPVMVCNFMLAALVEDEGLRAEISGPAEQALQSLLLIEAEALAACLNQEGGYELNKRIQKLELD